MTRDKPLSEFCQFIILSYTEDHTVTLSIYGEKLFGKLALIYACELPLCEYMPLHGVQGLFLRCTRFQIHVLVQRVKSEPLPMWMSRWRTGTTIADSLRVTLALNCTAGETGLSRHGFR